MGLLFLSFLVLKTFVEVSEHLFNVQQVRDLFPRLHIIFPFDEVLERTVLVCPLWPNVLIREQRFLPVNVFPLAQNPAHLCNFSLRFVAASRTQ